MDPLALGLGLGPLAVYLIWIGLINLRLRPAVITGWKDTACLALGMTGFVIVGPLNLFFPLPAYFRFGPWVWILLIALYALTITSVNLWMRPKIVIYNVPYGELRPVLSEQAIQLDPDARWAGECLLLPNLGVQLFLDYSPILRNAQLVAVGRKQDFQGWARLEAALRESLRQIEVGRNWAGLVFLGVGTLLGFAGMLGMLTMPEQVAEAFERLFLR